MNILTANQTTTTNFAVKIQEINTKYKKEKEDLKKIIAETARSQAEQILADNDDDSMGNPEELCQKLAELRLQYNSIVVKQKEEMDIVMDEYNVEIWNNMEQKKVDQTGGILLKRDEKIRLEVYDKYIGNCQAPISWYHWHPNEKWIHAPDGSRCPQNYSQGSQNCADVWFTAFKDVILKRMREKRAQQNK